LTNPETLVQWPSVRCAEGAWAESGEKGSGGASPEARAPVPRVSVETSAAGGAIGALGVVRAEAVAGVRFAETFGRLAVAVAVTRHAPVHRARVSRRSHQTFPTPEMQYLYFFRFQKQLALNGHVLEEETGPLTFPQQ
jgi:hypothetical protein